MQPESTDSIPEPIAQMPSAIELVGLSKRYGRNAVLDCLDLRVEKGELLVVLGDSGCGKSTLLKLISGIEKPLAGSIRIAGHEQTNIAPHQRDVAVVFQDGNGYEHLTVQRNLELNAKGSDSQQQISLWVDRLRLGSTRNRRLDQLSGGEAQRFAVARAMLSGKSIVLLDEPLTHLNQALREEIKHLIRTVHRESQKTFVYVTHDSDEAFYLATRIAVLADGRIQQVGDPRSVYLSPKSKTVALLLGQPSIDIFPMPFQGARLGSAKAHPMLECGVRSDQWSITRISLESPPEGASQPVGLAMADSVLEVRGAISECQWMGSHWLLEIQSSARIRIRCDARGNASMEHLLVRAEQFSRLGKPFGIVEATVPRSSIQTFGEAESGFA